MKPFQWKRSVFVVGLTGAIGSGKSAARACFEALGIRTMDADAVARSVLYSADMATPLRLAFGDGIFEEGIPSRSRLAAIVFADPAQRARLNEMIHPRVRSIFRETVQTLSPGEIFVYDVPLLFEAGFEAEFDCVLVLSASEQLRFERVKARNGWDIEEFHRRDQSQLSLLEKEKRADVVIRNEGSEEDLCRSIAEFVTQIKQASESKRKSQ